MVPPKNILMKKSSQKFLSKFFEPAALVRFFSSSNTGHNGSSDGHSETNTGDNGPKQSLHDFFKFYSDKKSSGYNYRQLKEKDYERFISKRSLLREPSITRQITSLAYKVGKEFISLAEGMPHDDVLPVNRITLQLKDGNELVLEGKQVINALQYLPTQGQPELLKELHKFQQDLHRPPSYEDRDILVTSGSQFGIYAAIELLVNYGDPVLVNTHTYTGFHAALKPYQPEIIGLPEDEGGTIPEYLESILADRQKSGKTMPKMLYMVPTGSNPSGGVVNEERRRTIYNLACKYDFIIVEDDPYMFMNYTDIPVPSLLSLDEECRVLRLDSLSKVVSPGVRVGWVTAPRPLLHRMELHLQADHLHCCSVGQALLCSLLQQWGRSGLASHLRASRASYLRRRDALHDALCRHVGARSLARWTLPDAGMFFWLQLNVEDVYQMVFKTAFEKGLMLIPGQACAFDTSLPSNYLRLAFGKIKLEDIDDSARLLAEIIEIEQKRKGVARLHGTATQH